MLESLSQMSLTDIIALFIAGVFGLVWHYVMKVVELRKTDSGMTLRRYYTQHVPETAGAVMTVIAGIWGLIEIGQASILSVALFGYTVDSHVNKFRSRGQGVLK